MDVHPKVPSVSQYHSNYHNIGKNYLRNRNNLYYYLKY